MKDNYVPDVTSITQHTPIICFAYLASHLAVLCAPQNKFYEIEKDKEVFLILLLFTIHETHA